MNHWAAKYIGIPWSATGEGPDSFNCWHFFQKVQREQYGVETLTVSTPPTLLGRVKLIADHQERTHWSEVKTPADGDAVLMGRSIHMCHIGVVIEAEPGTLGVLHCLDHSGVVFTPMDRLSQSGWPVTAFYRRTP